MPPINQPHKVFDDLPASPIKSLQKGEYFKRKPFAKAIYVKGEYDKPSKAYLCHHFDDTNQTLLIKSDKQVFHGFTF